MNFASRLSCFLTCVLMLIAAVVVRDKRIFGYDFKSDDRETPAITHNGQTYIIDTSSLAQNIIGFSGPTPLKIYIEKGIIVKIVADDNMETPSFFSSVKSQLLPKWQGLTLNNATNLSVDAVSGATLSSNAVIKNMQIGLSYALDAGLSEAGLDKKDKTFYSFFSFKTIFAFLVIIFSCLIPYFVSSHRVRILQLFLNVTVLGLWTGTFLSYSRLLNFVANGLNTPDIITTLVLVFIAFLLPLFGIKRPYCTNLCPYGSLQELAGMTTKHKLKIPSGILKSLNLFRQILWALLMLLMWMGIWFSWTDYELFAAFMLSNANTILVVVAVAFILLSAFIPRAYCRFICPTGTLLKII